MALCCVTRFSWPGAAHALDCEAKNSPDHPTRTGLSFVPRCRGDLARSHGDGRHAMLWAGATFRAVRPLINALLLQPGTTGLTCTALFTVPKLNFTSEMIGSCVRCSEFGPSCAA